MATYTSLHYHIVFSTKGREPWIAEAIEERVWTYLAGAASRHGMTPLIIGGLEDHLHLVIGLPPAMTVSRAVQLLKGASSHWIRRTFPKLEAFRWQDGYSAFTISTSVLPTTIEYVERQRVTHQARTFQHELRGLLRVHGVPFDERHIWN